MRGGACLDRENQSNEVHWEQSRSISKLIESQIDDISNVRYTKTLSFLIAWYIFCKHPLY